MVDIHTDDQVPPPSWPTCTHQTEESGGSCNGRQVDGFDHCLAHLEPEQLEQVLQRFNPGADLEAPGTSIDAALLERILSVVSGTVGRPTFGVVDLAQVHFTEGAYFNVVQFSGDARFDEAKFSGAAWFDEAKFSGAAWFGGARFSGDIMFGGAQFSGDTMFGGAQFIGDASFERAKFSRDVGFVGAQFSRDARFADATFEKATSVGPLTAGDLILRRAVFIRPIVLEAAAVSVTCTDDAA
jgi:hypothetical protein